MSSITHHCPIKPVFVHIAYYRPLGRVILILPGLLLSLRGAACGKLFLLRSSCRVYTNGMQIPADDIDTLPSKSSQSLTHNKSTPIQVFFDLSIIITYKNIIKTLIGAAAVRQKLQ